MIEFIETFKEDGITSARLHADGLPAGMHYVITAWPDGKCTARSKAYGNGSVRYYTHRTYEEAMGHGFKWAQRKIAEARKTTPGTSHEMHMERELIRLFGR